MSGRFARHSLAFATALIAVCAEAAASPLIPIAQAALSANGRVLCYLEVKQHSNNNDASYIIDSVTYHVLTFPETVGPNSYIGTLIPATTGRFWTGFADDWSITLNGSQALNWPIVSDDGATLVLVSSARPNSMETMLRVYHRGADYKPALVRSYKLADFWPANEVDRADREGGFDSTLPWYGSGIFAYASPGEVDYTNPWHQTIRVNVLNGELTR